MDPEDVVQPALTWGWEQSFVNRYSDDIKTAPVEYIERERAEVTPESVNDFMDLFEAKLKTEDYATELIANFDETMIQMSPRFRASIIPREGGRVVFTIDREGLHITMGAFVFANGDPLKPVLILPQKEFPVGPNYNLIDEFRWSGQDAGWMSTEIFEK